jgi:hypothetical protein
LGIEPGKPRERSVPSVNKTWAVVAVGVILIGAFSAVACGINLANQDRQGPESTASPAVASAPSPDGRSVSGEEPQLISVKEDLPARYDIPWEDGWLTAEQALEQALPAIGRAEKTGSLVPVSVRLTTFGQVSHGGEYLPAETPVWHVLFQADGRVWVRTSGPAILDPKDAYSHIAILDTVQVALHADSGDEIFVGFSGGRLDTTRELEPLEGVVAGETERNGDGLTVKTADGRTVNVLLPREMISEGVVAGSETRTRLTFWETLNLNPSTPVRVRGLTTGTGEFLAYALEAETDLGK